MKINKKLILATSSLALLGIASTPLLVSCSQGSSVNLKQYDINVGSEKYKITNNSYGKVDSNGAITTYSFNPSGKYSDDEIKDPKFIENQKETIKQNLFINISNYLYDIVNQYLNFLTRNPTTNATNNGESITGLVYNAKSREFELAYSLGAGEGQSTYRLKINSIDFNVNQDDIWPLNAGTSEPLLAYGKEIATTQVDGQEKPNLYKKTIEINNIILKFGYYKINGSSSYVNASLDEVKNSNYKEYWKNFTFDNNPTELTSDTFTITLNKKLYLNIQQSYFSVVENNVTKYKSNGSIQFIQSNANSDINTWPFLFSDTKPKDDTDFNAKIEEQTTTNNKIKNLLDLSNDNYNSFKNELKTASDAITFIKGLISIS